MTHRFQSLANGWIHTWIHTWEQCIGLQESKRALLMDIPGVGCRYLPVIPSLSLLAPIAITSSLHGRYRTLGDVTVILSIVSLGHSSEFRFPITGC